MLLLLLIERDERSEIPVSLRIFVYTGISTHAHLYMNSYIHELLVICLQGFISGFETSMWLITDGFR